MTQEEYKKNVREVYRTTAILSVVTIVEVVGALMYEKYAMPAGYPRIVLSIFVSVASLIKAYWIMAVFMHVNHEKKGFAFTILFPFSFAHHLSDDITRFLDQILSQMHQFFPQVFLLLDEKFRYYL